MSELLTRLARRQLGELETVRPRIAPMFAAPAPRAAEVVTDEAERSTLRDVDERALGSALRPRSAIVPGALEAEPDALEVNWNAPVHIAPSRGARVVEDAAAAEALSARIAPERGAPPPATQHRFPPASPSWSAAASSEAPPRPTREGAAPPPRLVPSAPALGAVLAPSVAGSDVARTSTVERVERPSSGAEFAGLRSRAVESQAAPVPPSLVAPAAARGRPPGVSKDAAEPPPVFVTIGRVEVSALPAPVAARPPAPRRPQRPSLGDYLTQRERPK